MDTIPLEIIDHILNMLNPESYNNYILAYDRATELWYNINSRKKYKNYFLEYISINRLQYHIRRDNYRRHGKQYTLREDGSIADTINYVNGIVNGKAIFYYPNGNISCDKDYINGRATWENYNIFSKW